MKASQVYVYLFDGDRQSVQHRVNEFLRHLGAQAVEPDIAALGYNYQGPEYDGRAAVEGSASHGLMLVALYPTLSEISVKRGFDPVADQPGAVPQGEGVTVVPLDDFLRSFAGQAPQPGRGLWGSIKKWFRR